MKERPILFSAPMVRAILSGAKTQTRRVVKPARGRPIEFLGGGPVGGPDWNNPECWGYEHHDSATWVLLRADKSADTAAYPSPYGWRGDKLWVREAWQYADWTEDGLPFIGYRANSVAELREKDIPEEWTERLQDTWITLSDPDNYKIDGRAADRRWRPGIHMPRWACRLVLDVVDVRVERLQSISESDALAEGIVQLPDGFGLPAGEHFHGVDPRQSYLSLWEAINGPGSVEANPWVWVVEFRRVEAQAASRAAMSAAVAL